MPNKNLDRYQILTKRIVNHCDTNFLPRKALRLKATTGVQNRPLERQKPRRQPKTADVSNWRHKVDVRRKV